MSEMVKIPKQVLHMCIEDPDRVHDLLAGYIGGRYVPSFLSKLYLALNEDYDLEEIETVVNAIDELGFLKAAAKTK